MPEVMIRYRAATFFASIYYPELAIGIEEEDDALATPQNVPVKVEAVVGGEIAEPQPEAPAKPKRKKAEAKAQEPKPEPVEPEPVEAEYEEVKEPEAKPAPVVSPQDDDGEEWDNWED